MATTSCRSIRRAALFFALALAAGPAFAADDPNADLGPLTITRITTPIVVDGNLEDAAWQSIAPVTTFFETNLEDNVKPAVENKVWLAYDDQFLYAAFFCEEPDIGSVRAPLGDHDNVPGYTDYAGLILDPRGEGKMAQMFLANWRGVQYDAITADSSGEDSAPDFYWDSVGKLTEKGWTLEIRIPFSSLRYADPNPVAWKLLIYRNHPREFRRQYFSSRLPRESNCFICNSRPLVGLADLPSGAHWVLAPYATAGIAALPESGLGSPLETGDGEFEVGLDAKWIPNPETVVDATLNPDFSQIESDAPEITANERFAILFPEKRPFFLESLDLFSSPLQAVYTRTFTSPRWGLRASGDFKGTRYTVLAGEDRGGGVVVLPGAESSSFADQDFESMVALARLRRTVGKAEVSFLYTGREIDEGGFNRVYGPDFEWRPTAQDAITGQLLFSDSETPDRPDLAAEWDGRELSGHAAELKWGHNSRTWDWTASVRDISEEFRADNGFVPQVGYRRYFGDLGYTWRPEKSKISRFRLYTYGQRDSNRDGGLLYSDITPGFGFDSILNSYIRLEFTRSEVGYAGQVFERFQVRPSVELRPGGLVSYVYLSATLGDDTDFAGLRDAHGQTFRLNVDFRPGDHLVVGLNAYSRELEVAGLGGDYQRLFASRSLRLRGVYTFNSKTWLRLIAQYDELLQDNATAIAPVDEEQGDFTGSLVFAYKLNWQTVLFVGFGDQRELDQFDELRESGQQAFFKISYAFQR